MKTNFVKKVGVASGINSYFFSPERPVKYTAGQFIEMTIKHENADDRGQKRWFTLSSPPDGEYLSITTRYAPEIVKPSSFKVALNKLNAGDVLDISDPMGDFVLPIDKTIPLLFVAGGIGITPYLSILGYLQKTHEKRTISLIYSVKSANELIDIDKYRSLLKSCQEIVNDNKTSTEVLNPDLVINRAKALRGEPLIYLAGPEKMIESFGNQLVASGIKRSRLVSDYFLGYDT